MSILSAIANTPLVELTNLNNKRPKVRIFGKLEAANPSGSAVAGALRIAEGMASGTIVVILPDQGDRYLSTTLFRSICAKCPP